MMPVITVSVREILNCKPGDPCPDDGCHGIFHEISIFWTKDVFYATGKCNTCHEDWTLEEQALIEEEDDGNET